MTKIFSPSFRIVLHAKNVTENLYSWLTAFKCLKQQNQQQQQR